MFTTGSKYFFGVGTLFLLAAVVYGWSSGGVDWGLLQGHLGDLYFAMLGALTLGYRGAVGDHVGYTVLIGTAASCFGLGGFMIAFRDNEARSVAEVAGTARVPAYRMPFSPNWWAPLGGLGFAVMVLGLVTTPALIVAGAVVLAFVALEWTMQAWADRATGDPRINKALRDRIMNPIELPVVGVLVVAFVALGFSRVLLAVPKEASVWITVAVAALIFLVAIGLASVPSLGRHLLAAVVVLAAVAVLAGGIVAAAQGERTFHHDETEEVGAAGGSEAESSGGASSTTTTAHK